LVNGYAIDCAEAGLCDSAKGFKMKVRARCLYLVAIYSWKSEE
jgi:hypothetical protein